MKRLLNSVLLMTGACISFSMAAAQSSIPDSNNLVALLAEVQATNGFSGDTLKPWHLKANYELYDATDKIIGKGVFEEWWGAQNQWRRSYTGNHYTGTEYRLPSGYAYEGGPAVAYVADMGTADEAVRETHTPWPEALIAEKLLYPINYRPLNPLAIESDSWHMHFVRPLAASESLTCLDPLSYASHREEYYCFTSGGHQLRQSRVHFVTTNYNQTGIFQNRFVGFDTDISINDHDLLKVHVVSLDELPSIGDVFPPNMQTVAPPATCLGATTFVSEWNYPANAKEKHLQGVVVLVGVIETDGNLGSVRIVESPDPSMTSWALSKVRRWGVLQPALLNGEPIPCRFGTMFDFQLRK
jgi:Gram-negative bacterial TonB protein C-terminal